MRILITNDDGINAPGLEVMEAIAADIAGPEGEVWVVAPAFEQSGVGHAVSYIHPTMIAKLGPRRFAAEGTPADCVLAGLHHVLEGERPDLVLSGVNRGNNAGENVVYSGTIGGAMEAALQGVPAIALSQFYGPQTARLDDPFEAARRHGTATVRRLLRGEAGMNGDYRIFYNVNFPPVAADAVAGIRAVRQGYRPGAGFSVESYQSPGGRQFLWVRGGAQAVETGAGTDVAENLAGFITVTPLSCDMTVHGALDGLRERLQ